MASFNAKRLEVSHMQNITASRERVFPLLCPKREYEWIEPWQCSMIYSESGIAEENAVFSTEFSGDSKEIWYTDRYEPFHLIQFIRFSKNRIIRQTITLSEENPQITKAVWSQVITALNEEGNCYINSFSFDNYKAEIRVLEKMLNFYLETGTMLKLE